MSKRNLKKLVAERQAKTGESYQAALRQVRETAGAGRPPIPKLREWKETAAEHFSAAELAEIREEAVKESIELDRSGR